MVVLRGTSCRRALWEAGTNCQLVGGSIVYTCPWWRGCAALSRTALESSGEVWISWTNVCVRASLWMWSLSCESSEEG